MVLYQKIQWNPILGERRKKNFKHISDPEIETMSKLQKDLSLQTEKSENHDQIKQ